MRRAIVDALACVAALGLAPGALAQRDPFQPQVPEAEVRLWQQAQKLREQKKPKEAAELLQGVVQRQPGYFNAQFELGLALSDDQSTLGASTAAFEKAAAIKRADPAITNARVFNSLAWAYMYTGRMPEAGVALKEAEQHVGQLDTETQRKLYNNLGYFHLNTGDRAAAERYLRIATDKYGSPQAKRNLKTLEAVRQQDKK